MSTPLIIAEFGSSPARTGWPFNLLCDEAMEAGADAVKIQLFRADHFPDREREVKYRLEFPRDRLPEFARAAHDRYLMVGASVFDEEAVKLASEHCDFIKLAAREQYNSDLIFQVFNQNKRIFRSVSDLSFGAGDRKSDQVTTLYAVQRYPTPMSLALYWLIRFSMHCKRNRHRWGWSSHTRGALDCITAARFGASVIEKHFVLSRRDVEAGHSLLPSAFKCMVNDIRK